MDFSNMNMTELENLSNDIYREITRRKRSDQIKKWTAITEMIKDYIHSYGDITIRFPYDDDVVIHGAMDFDTVGQIEEIDD